MITSKKSIRDYSILNLYRHISNLINYGILDFNMHKRKLNAAVSACLGEDCARVEEAISASTDLSRESLFLDTSPDTVKVYISTPRKQGKYSSLDDSEQSWTI